MIMNLPRKYNSLIKNKILLEKISAMNSFAAWKKQQ